MTAIFGVRLPFFFQIIKVTNNHINETYTGLETTTTGYDGLDMLSIYGQLITVYETAAGYHNSLTTVSTVTMIVALSGVFAIWLWNEK